MSSDQNLDVALAQFNNGLERQRSRQQAERAVNAADRAKQEAAATLKRLQSDDSASADDRAAAESTYREAMVALNRLRAGEAPDDATSGAAAEPTPESTPTTDSDPVEDAPHKDPVKDQAEGQGVTGS